MKKKIKIPSGWRKVKRNYVPKPDEKKSFSSEWGWIIIGTPIEPKAKKKEVPGG